MGKKMTEEEMMKDRFLMKAAEISDVVFSQCRVCVYNIDFWSCGTFGNKPGKYKDNLEDCPRYEKE